MRSGTSQICCQQLCVSDAVTGAVLAIVENICRVMKAQLILSCCTPVMHSNQSYTLTHPATLHDLLYASRAGFAECSSWTVVTRGLMLTVKLTLQTASLNGIRRKRHEYTERLSSLFLRSAHGFRASNSGAIRLCTVRPLTSRSHNPGLAGILYTTLPVSIVSLRKTALSLLSILRHPH